MSLLEPQVRRWTVEDYHRAAEGGAFAPDERLELIEGEIYQMSPQKGPHATACELAEDALEIAFGPGCVVRGQKPLSLGLSSEPEPDVAVVRGSHRDFAAAHPTTALLVVEVAETSARLDLGPKAAMYARGGIEDYWVVVLPERVVVVHRDPDAATGAYRTVTRHDERATLAPLATTGAAIWVADLLP